MLHSFSLENFYSFGEAAEVSFVVNEKAPKNDGYISALSGTRLSKVETVIGPNASGKTNLLKAIPFMKWLLLDSFTLEPTALLPVKPHALNGQNVPVRLCATFEIAGSVYTYEFLLSEIRILSEKLWVRNKTKDNVTTKLLVSREWSKEKNGYLLDDQGFDLPKGFEGLMRENASIVSVSHRLNHVPSLNITAFWQKIETNVTEEGWVGPQFQSHLVKALLYYSQNNDLKLKAEKLLSQFDLGLGAFEIVHNQSDSGTQLSVNVAHAVGKQKYALPLQYESSGTRQLMVLLKGILLTLGRGGVVVFDELEVSLHPDMVMKLLELFLDPETNPYGAQILFSTHSHRVLTRLDKYQVVLVEKDASVSEAWRLDEVGGVRADDNYYAKYIAGAYGAMPNL